MDSAGRRVKTDFPYRDLVWMCFQLTASTGSNCDMPVAQFFQYIYSKGLFNSESDTNKSAWAECFFYIQLNQMKNLHWKPRYSKPSSCQRFAKRLIGTCNLLFCNVLKTCQSTPTAYHLHNNNSLLSYSLPVFQAFICSLIAFVASENMNERSDSDLFAIVAFQV